MSETPAIPRPCVHKPLEARFNRRPVGHHELLNYPILRVYFDRPGPYGRNKLVEISQSLEEEGSPTALFVSAMAKLEFTLSKSANSDSYDSGLDILVDEIQDNIIDSILNSDPSDPAAKDLLPIETEQRAAVYLAAAPLFNLEKVLSDPTTIGRVKDRYSQIIDALRYEYNLLGDYNNDLSRIIEGLISELAILQALTDSDFIELCGLVALPALPHYDFGSSNIGDGNKTGFDIALVDIQTGQLFKKVQVKSTLTADLALGREDNYGYADDVDVVFASEIADDISGMSIWQNNRPNANKLRQLIDQNIQITQNGHITEVPVHKIARDIILQKLFQLELSSQREAS